MKLPDPRARLVAASHGVLATVHPERGADAVPCVYAVDGDLVGIPVDRVKPKAAARLRRERNLELDPRATLLVEHWDPADWSRLWWVRASLAYEGSGPAPALAALLARAWPQYATEPFDRILVLRILAVTGWAAVSPPPE
jgi:hypothetical protein